jgi:LysM repeat protein
VRSLRQYRLFVTLLVLPVLAVVLIVVLVMALTSGDEELPAAAAPTAAAATVGGPLPTPTSSGVPPIATPIVVVPTQAPVPEATPTPAPTPTEPPVPTPTPAPEGPIEYAVQESDTLFSIASAYGVSVADLVEFNDLPDENFIFVGQVLEVPTDPAQVAERRGSRPVVTTAVVVPSDGLNVRAAPNTDTGAVQYVAPGGSELALTGVVEVIDGIEWREVTDGNWVQAQYLEIGVRAAPTAAPAATATPQPTQAPTGDTVQATVVPTAGLNVRSSPDSNASVAYVAPGASELQLTGDTQVVTGVTWWQLTDGNWVQGQFLKFG